MRLNQPDIVVVGGGIAGASLSAVLARRGIRVLLLERQRGYRDRVRGEFMAPWGVLEARALGLEDVIRSTRAVDARYSVAYDELVDPSAAEAALGGELALVASPAFLKRRLAKSCGTALKSMDPARTYPSSSRASRSFPGSRFWKTSRRL